MRSTLRHSIAAHGVQASHGTAEAVPRSVGYWLLGNGALVFTMVVVGGVTRLTDSGLSMTTWKPLGAWAGTWGRNVTGV